MEYSDIALVDWSRWQFALTATYHWIFVPLTLGLSFIIAIMESFYVKTGDEAWKRMTQFWMKLFGINFAMGIATGLILEFQFGTNWSNYAWFVGDIFGAPLAIEGMFAFFLESTFVAVMFFGWNKVGKKFHLLSTWLVAFGATLSAWWILVANAWMQNPVGMHFNPETMRNEMYSFVDVAFSGTAVNKFLHTVSSAYLLGAIFVVGVSAWFLLKKRHQEFAKRSMKIAGVFGLIMGLLVAFTGDGSAVQVSKNQPMKLAAMEGLYKGKTGAGLILFGIYNPHKEPLDNQDAMLWKIEIPKLLSLLSKREANAFVPGIDDFLQGNQEQGVMSFEEKKERGMVAVETFRMANQQINNSLEKQDVLNPNTAEGQYFIENYFNYFGYAYIPAAKESVPPVALTFYGFHLMVLIGGWMIALLLLVIFFTYKKDISNHRWLLKLSVISIPMVYLASMLGWMVAEVGRQPWVIQNLMTTFVGVTNNPVRNVQITFWIFAVLFTVMLLVELRIMFTQIKKGPEQIQ